MSELQIWFAYLALCVEEISAFLAIRLLVLSEIFISDLFEIDAVKLQLHASCHCVNLVNAL